MIENIILFRLGVETLQNMDNFDNKILSFSCIIVNLFIILASNHFWSSDAPIPTNPFLEINIYPFWALDRLN